MIIMVGVHAEGQLRLANEEVAVTQDNTFPIRYKDRIETDPIKSWLINFFS